MASNFSLSANPSTVNPGGTSTITVSVDLRPEQDLTVKLEQDGNLLASAPLMIPAEQFPAIKLAGDQTITAGDYVLSTDLGSLAATSDPAVFTLTE